MKLRDIIKKKHKNELIKAEMRSQKQKNAPVEDKQPDKINDGEGSL